MGITAMSDMLEGYTLSSQQRKAIAFNVSYITKGIPINGPIKMMKLTGTDELAAAGTNYVMRELNRLSKNIDGFIKDNPTKKNEIEHLEQMKKDLIPAKEQDMNMLIPEDSLEVLKTNKWTDQDPDTGAAGIYQFTPQRWDELSEQNPELGLTDNGRVSENPDQQETAMKRTNVENARGLTALRVEVNNTNLYGSHRFGLDNYVRILDASNSEKLTKVVDDMTLFKGFKSVKQVKTYVNGKVKKN